MTSLRSMPSSFDSSSGVRWFAMSLLSGPRKNPPARCADGLVRSLTPCADVVAAVAEREGLLRAAVAGHSLGGLVALRLALRRPDAVRALLLVSGAGISSGPRAREAAVTTLVLARPARLVAPLPRPVPRVRGPPHPGVGLFPRSR